jgi:hypothetical protein
MAYAADIRRALMAAGLLECRTLDGHTQELVHRPTRHG